MTDNEGDWDTASATVTVANVAPTADAGGPYNDTDGSGIVLDASGSTDPGNDIASYLWDLDDDGLFDDASGMSPTFPAANAGTYTVWVRVTDENGESDTDLAIVAVSIPVGDMDLDVDVDDINDFVLGLNDAAQYESVYGVLASFAGDADGDGDVDFDDIDDFVALLNSGVLAQRSGSDGQVAAVVALSGGGDAVPTGEWVTLGMDPVAASGRGAERPLARSGHGAGAARVHDRLVDRVWRDVARARPARPHWPWRTRRTAAPVDQPPTDGLLAAVWSGDDDWILAQKLNELD